MGKKDKELLFQDLCGRLPYGVIIEGLEHPEIMTIKHLAIISVMSTEPYKPYLRPMSSMTEEERKEYKHIAPRIVIEDGIRLPNINQINWLNAHHFDYRGLIEKGLAIEAPEGMYKK